MGGGAVFGLVAGLVPYGERGHDITAGYRLRGASGESGVRAG